MLGKGWDVDTNTRIARHNESRQRYGPLLFVQEMEGLHCCNKGDKTPASWLCQQRKRLKGDDDRGGEHPSQHRGSLRRLHRENAEACLL